MLKPFCDSCSAPIAPEDNHLEIGDLRVFDKGQIANARMLHLCGKGCLNAFLDKAFARPILITPPSQTINGN